MPPVEQIKGGAPKFAAGSMRPVEQIKDSAPKIARNKTPASPNTDLASHRHSDTLKASMNPSDKPAVLVIFYTAFGDLATRLPGILALRKHHPGAHLVCLTRAGMAENIRAFNTFDEYILDPAAGPRETLKFLRALRRRRFARIYDLQGYDRTVFYRMFLPVKQPRNQMRPGMFVFLTRNLVRRVRASLGIPARHIHQHEGIKQMWRDYGITPADTINPAAIPPLAESVAAALPAGDFALLAPGSSIPPNRGRDRRWPPRDLKRWPSRNFGEIARRLADKNIRPVVVGTAGEAHLLETIRAACPAAIDLLGATGPADLIHLGLRARVMVSGDTGPVHWASLGGVPVVSLFGSDVSPELWAPRNSVVLESRPLALLEPDAVWRAVERQLEQKR